MKSIASAIEMILIKGKVRQSKNIFKATMEIQYHQTPLLILPLSKIKWKLETTFRLNRSAKLVFIWTLQQQRTHWILLVSKGIGTDHMGEHSLTRGALTIGHPLHDKGQNSSSKDEFQISSWWLTQLIQVYCLINQSKKQRK